MKALATAEAEADTKNAAFAFKPSHWSPRGIMRRGTSDATPTRGQFCPPSAHHFREAQSDLILAIEEPEIYQHPTKQRMFGDVLRNLSRGFSTETGIRVQVLFVTHSPLLISLPRCDEIRLVRRVNDGHTNNVIAASTSLQSCSERSAVASGRRADEAFSPTQYAAKLHTFDSRIAEGFFARKVLLVEGVGDKAVLEAYYCLDGRNPQAEGIVIAQVDGKNNLDRPIVVFKSLGVPCFWVFDNDRTEGEKKESKKAGSAKNTIDTNRILQRLADVREEDLVDWPVGVTAAYASWDSKIEKYIRSKVADPQVYERIIAAVSSEFDIERDMCLKFPASASRMLARLSDEGVRFPELAELVERVDAL